MVYPSMRKRLPGKAHGVKHSQMIVLSVSCIDGIHTANRYKLGAATGG
ncbi:hypothetical protein B0G77_6259 [Paraburkholderia sp. BL10I2N1]|nr:hypothetical protein B0G77_6259 [Paraburkholderia sp. BL10I2N1]